MRTAKRNPAADEPEQKESEPEEKSESEEKSEPKEKIKWKKRGKAKKEKGDPIAKALVMKLLTEIVDEWPRDCHLFTDLSENNRLNTMKLPLSCDDGRKASWKNVCKQLADSLMNSPQSTKDCWYVKATDKNGAVKNGRCSGVKKINKHNFPTHRVTYQMLYFEDELPNDLFVHHRCSRGNAAKVDDPVCFNPYHLKTSYSTAENRDDEGCRYGFSDCCPHEPVCIWTDKGTGRFLSCVNKGRSKRECKERGTCDPPCYK